MFYDRLPQALKNGTASQTRESRHAKAEWPESWKNRDWKWDQDHPVHFIAHSQGGNTVRLLIELMKEGQKVDPGREKHEYFQKKGRDTWIRSLVTLATPHQGTTLPSALEVCLLGNPGEYCC